VSEMNLFYAVNIQIEMIGLYSVNYLFHRLFTMPM